MAPSLFEVIFIPDPAQGRKIKRHLYKEIAK